MKSPSRPASIKIEGRTTPVSEAIKVFDSLPRRDSFSKIKMEDFKITEEKPKDVKSVLGQFMETSHDEDNIVINFGTTEESPSRRNEIQLTDRDASIALEILAKMSKSDIKKWERIKTQYENRIIDRQEYLEKKMELEGKYK